MPETNPLIGGVPVDRVHTIRARESAAFAQSRPKTQAALENGAAAFLDGVPMLWMLDWPQPFPMLVAEAEGARLTDIDGNQLDDFCLGDTGSMFGHSPPAVAEAIARQAAHGLTYMLPTLDALAVGQLLQEKFGPFRWQIATTATDANRFAIRVARAVTGRPKVLFFAGCYHGAVDDAMGRNEGGRTVERPGLVGQVVDLDQTSVVVEFNDLPALEAALAKGNVAAVLAEPVMTNCCMVLPAEGYHDGLRALTRKYGTLLIIDETHTISSGLGGYTRTHGLDPDMFVLGKPVAGGLPASVWGMTEEMAARYADFEATRSAGFSGIGTTLSANPLQFAAMKANLTHVMTAENYAHMEAGAERLAAGLSEAIARHKAPWHCVRVGARVEFICHPTPLRNGSESYQAHKPELEKAIHAALVNKGCLIAPFHNMMLVSPATSFAQIDRLITAFNEITRELMS
ncbi:MAG: aspartate aminotransferase family protein [Hoeflea sp.]|uniref:aspartate aminotransferase family protein n=1 Tax=Hoeflea sp. TaxID=1940281 RepID=UPI002731D5AD|nr:aspartate aminotransferase family protein [Hoeflea sp.]MDP2122558.1 aspartate aminotransferase family protein [Hoeflea sp.]MDZ7603064.1 aspartate aminotransferase family protein [Hoeflea sp.]